MKSYFKLTEASWSMLQRKIGKHMKLLRFLSRSRLCVRRVGVVHMYRGFENFVHESNKNVIHPCILQSTQNPVLSHIITPHASVPSCSSFSLSLCSPRFFHAAWSCAWYSSRRLKSAAWCDDARSHHLWQHKPVHRSELFTKAHELELVKPSKLTLVEDEN